MERTPAHDPPDVPPDPGQSPASTADVPPFALATGPLSLSSRTSDTAQLQIVVDHVKDAILTVGGTGRIETMNRTAERVFGYDEDTVRGRKLDQLLPMLGRNRSLTVALDEMAEDLEDTQIDLSPRETRGRRADGTLFDAEIGVSKVRLDSREAYIVCLRDTTERKHAETALRDSEARYRTLVENAPEAIVVYDVDLERFVECNDNAVRFFKMTRDELLRLDLVAISAPEQADGPLHLVTPRGHIDRALGGDAPCFEWITRDAMGHDIPCEVRLVRLPSSGRRLIRGSIIDITERKRAEFLVAGERRVFERITGNAELAATLEAIAETGERVTPDAICTISLYDAAPNQLRRVAGERLPAAVARTFDVQDVGPRNGSCAAAVFLQRQVIVAEIGRDALWEHVREPALEAGLRACWSTPIRTEDCQILGTLALWFRRPRSPLRRDFELMSRLATLAAIAIERRQAEEALRQSEARYRGLFDNVIEGVYREDAQGRLETVNPALVEMLGYERDEDLLALPSTAQLYVDPADRARMLRQLDRDGRLESAEYQLRRQDGRVITVVENSRVVYDCQGRVAGYEGTLADITKRKQAELQLADEKEKAQVTLQAIGDAVLTADALGRVEYLNPVAERLTGWTTGEASGRPVAEVLQLIDESSRAPVDSPVLRCLRDDEVVEPVAQTLLVNRLGQEISVQDSAAPIRDRNGRLIGAVMVFHDVSQERRLQRALSYQATHDVLTGLINRREFEVRLGEALDDARNSELRYVLMYLDLDQFKVVNDTCGHAAGDRLLKQVTGVLQTRIRTTDVLARLGGDEFGVLLRDCTLETASRIAESLRLAIRDFRFEWGERVMRIGVSIGLAEITAESATPAGVMSAADVACYSAKDSGRNRVQTYDQGRAPERHREMEWVSRITRACEEDLLALVCQPIVPIRTGLGTTRLFELLLRMREPDGTLVQPSEFIPAAERYGLMPALDRWVVRQTCTRLAHRRTDAARRAPYTLTVNLSGATLNDEQFLEFVLTEIAAADLSPGALCFEITEAGAMTSLSAATRFIDALRSRGCLFALDDFGSGLSSFMFLRNLPVDFLKLDGQFMQNVAHDHIDRSMVGAIAQVSETMGIRTIAERVDSAEVLARLADVGIQYAQGNYIGAPLPVEVLESLVADEPSVVRLTG